MTDRFPQYTTDYISGVMSLRWPQSESLAILDKIMNSVKLRKGMDTGAALDSVRELYPTCTNFEREFMSLTFALATGVGKTRLMGAFIAYLYTNHNVRNFFITAPNTTIYEKLKRELTESSSPKYIFKGLGCFDIQPQIYTEDDYRSRQISISEESGLRIFVYNIDKFNKEDAKMKRANEIIGESFYEYLSNLNDLVLIMDESHHYRAERGAAALNELKPVLGLELTATPIVNKGSKQILFKNVVYEYPLSRAIEDGYTRTPFAVTRADINFYNFGDEQLDKLMLCDGITCHENAKRNLKSYAANHNKKAVKPFMLVVCKDTEHAEWVEKYIRSNEFRGGRYKFKTLIIHSKQKGAESEGNTRLLLDVENPANPIEIVIHVNMLKEGWDVNNLYTIVPLRTAASKILREQMVGRGLRLPYGERTGDREIDAVMLTAHDKFADILAEAQRGDSIFKAGNIIKVEEIEDEEIISPQLTFSLEPEKIHDEAYKLTNLTPSEELDRFFERAEESIREHVYEGIAKKKSPKEIAEKVAQEISDDKDLGVIYQENIMPLASWTLHKTEETHTEARAKFIPIPQIRVTDTGIEDYGFDDFDLDLAAFNQVPIGEDLMIQSLTETGERKFIKGSKIDFGAFNYVNVLLSELCRKPEIDYEKFSGLILKLIKSACDKYENKYGFNGLCNIVMMNKREIANEIYRQMLQHVYQKNGFIQEEIIGSRDHNIKHEYKYKTEVNLYENFTGNISNVLFTGIKKGVFDSAKFDSKEGELTLARLLENDSDVKNWLRPAPLEFNITYNHGRRYEPDFVIETSNTIYLTEVKGEDRLNDPDVTAKKERGIKYCAAASRWGRANGYKSWEYLFIPATQIKANSTFKQLTQKFTI